MVSGLGAGVRTPAAVRTPLSAAFKNASVYSGGRQDRQEFFNFG